MSLLGVVIFIGSFLGFAGFLQLSGAPSYLAYLGSFVYQTILLYILALVGQLSLALKLVPALGILLFIVVLVRIFLRHQKINSTGFHYFDLWMIVIGGLMARILYASPLIHYDNYSHWAVMVKFMLYEGHLPTAADKLIEFTSYPPATALFITQFTSLVGFSAGAMILAQFMLIWASAYAIFAVLRDHTRVLFTFILCFAIAVSNVFNIAIRMNNLLVDFVLPLVAVAGIAGIYYFRHQPRWQIGYTFLIASELLLIKNSGTFFVILLALYLLYWRVKSPRLSGLKKVGQVVASLVVSIGGSYGLFYTWQSHVHATFTSVSKHEISTKAYAKQLSGEGAAHIVKILKRMIQQIFSWGSLSTEGLLFINAVLLLVFLLIRFYAKKKNNLLRVLMILDVIFLVYTISLFLMYILSMPYAEAIVLDGFERYMSSMVVLNLFLAAMAIVVALDKALAEQTIEKRNLRSFQSIFTKNVYQISGLVLMLFSVILMFSEINGIEYNNSIAYKTNELPVQMTAIMKQTTTYNHTKVLVVDPHKTDVDNYYAGYVGRYYFFSDQVVGQENFDLSAAAFKKTIAQYQYIAIPEWHRTFTKMVTKVYGQKVKTGLYKVTAKGLVKVNKVS
jgi:hypothetical protein